MLHSISDFERISDRATNIVESAEEMKDKHLTFSESAAHELGVICAAVGDILTQTADIFSKEDVKAATHIEPFEEVIDSLTKKIKQHHVKRLQKGKCTIEMGLILEDVLTNLERVSDHCSNIAVEMMAISDNSFDTHEYFEEMSKEDRKAFTDEYNMLKAKYSLKKEED